MPSYSTSPQEGSAFKVNKFRTRCGAARLDSELSSGLVSGLTVAAQSGVAVSRTGPATPALTVYSAGSDSGFDSGDDAASRRDASGDSDCQSSSGPQKLAQRSKVSKLNDKDGDLACHPLLMRAPQRQSSLAIGQAQREFWASGNLACDTKLQDMIAEPSHENEYKNHTEYLPHTQHGSAPSNNLIPLNTSYLAPKTHKLTNGSVTVLPSKSLLVDLREGERRKGRKGDEVLVISPDGQLVSGFLRI